MPKKPATAVTVKSLEAWLETPEWALLMQYMREHESEFTEALINVDPKDWSKIAKAQALLDTVRMFTTGEIIELLKGRCTVG